ncbi:hypothetical protein L249_3430 [Ophiocordyceps polyrhachis-furcata BCC 54312]|uniref:Uncharacterized protein n=1 Tax=Ophiocordyceps polyrhachis-furcata BCC 54312 TaxID=1330021 RepID=A0A367LMI7_9HYPO|nr:hypothetical protein L249_3430 [Ophiocordyceps polyrhachis-furcata BCC 54312]
MDANPPHQSETQIHASNLDHTLKELQRRVQEHEAELQRLRGGPGPAPASLSPNAQSAVIKAALEEVTKSEPFLPSPNSVLPALVALRKTHRVIIESEAELAAQKPRLDRAKSRLESAQAALTDQKLLGDALTVRIQSLRSRLESFADHDQDHEEPSHGALRRMDTLRAVKDKYDANTASLMRSLLAFIDNHLAAMLAAEELGGPVVGSATEAHLDHLDAGFNAQGKPNKIKDKAQNQDRRQRRIDDIWGAGRDGAVDDEVAAAAAEMQRLTEELLNTLVEARGDSSASYVRLARESAAARFLVRSQVAQFHPKDATRLRLVDFGRELES